MRTIRRPSRGQVARAMRAWRTFARPPDPEKETPAGEAGAEGTQQEERPDIAGPTPPILSKSGR